MRKEKSLSGPRHRSRAFLLFFLFPFSFFLPTGCSRLPPGNPASRGLPNSSADAELESFESVRADFSKASDAISCRTALQHLNSYLGRHPEVQLPVLETEEADRLKTEFQLDPGEVEELRSKAFTLLDAHYLDSCILLREASQSLHLDGSPRRAQAAAAFAWVVRQVRLREDIKEIAPPQFALHRGWGMPLERAYVFIDLLRQMSFTACLIAVPGAGEQAGPQWWAVGVVDDKDIVLFDPRLGLPIPGPGGCGIATLEQACSAPQVLEQLTVDKKTPYDITADSARKATIYLTCPLSGLAPRMSYLQEQVLSAPQSLRLRVDPRVLASQPAFKGRNIGFLGRGAGPDSPLRLLRSFLPRAEGGADRSQPGRKISLDQSVIPWENLPKILQIQTLPGEPGRRLRNAFILPFFNLLLVPNSPRDLLLRGRVEEATTGLVSVREELKQRSQAAQSEVDLEQRVTEWRNEAIKAYAGLSRSQNQDPSGQSLDAETIRRQVEELWKDPAPLRMVDRSVAEPLGGEITYLLALCKHETAERAQTKLDRSGAKATPAEVKSMGADWGETAHWWQTYLENYPAGAGAAAARWWRARALEKLGDRQTAAAVLQVMSDDLTPLEKTARLYLVQRLKTGQ